MSPNHEGSIYRRPQESMSEAIWDELEANFLALRLHLGERVFSAPTQAVFQAEYADTAQNVRKVLVRVFRDDKRSSSERLNRLLEATYFEHSHLVRYIQAGTLQTDEDIITYAITERTDTWVARSLAAEQAVAFAKHVLSGLEYLHAKNLVYCVLCPRTVVPGGSDWKLSDFSQLRVAGVDMTDEVLSLAETLDTSPPEAAEGVISPAWDVWSFGQTLWKVIDGHRSNTADPFKAVLLACLNFNPSLRPTLNQLSALLESAESSALNRGISAAAKA